jgi:hypothetical protein
VRSLKTSILPPTDCQFVCTQDPKTSPVIDFSGNPSCEHCFDAEAYKAHGVPPSPHLSQSPFKPAALRPVLSKWGGSSRASLSPSTSTGLGARGNDGEKEKAWRVRTERQKSPMVLSFDELGEKLRKAGLEEKTVEQRTPTATREKAEVKKSRDTTRPLLNNSPTVTPKANRGWSLNTPIQPSTALAPTPAPSPATPQVASMKHSVSPLLPIVPRSSIHPLIEPVDTKPIPKPSTGSVAEETCPVCRLALGYGEFIQLPKTGEVLHRGCFKCGGCGEKLEAGRHVEAEDKVWHQRVSSAIVLEGMTHLPSLNLTVRSRSSTLPVHCHFPRRTSCERRRIRLIRSRSFACRPCRGGRLVLSLRARSWSWS